MKLKFGQVGEQIGQKKSQESLFLIFDFQPHSSITAKVDSKNVFLRYRDFKLRDPFFMKIDLFWPNISEILKIIAF